MNHHRIICSFTIKRKTLDTSEWRILRQFKWGSFYRDKLGNLFCTHLVQTRYHKYRKQITNVAENKKEEQENKFDACAVTEARGKWTGSQYPMIVQICILRAPSLSTFKNM